MKWLFSPYFFMAHAVFVKNYIYFGIFEIQNLSFKRFHNNTNLSQEKNKKAPFLCKESWSVEKRWGLLNSPSWDLLQISYYSLAACNHSLQMLRNSQSTFSESDWQLLKAKPDTPNASLTKPCEMAALINSNYTECNSSSVNVNAASFTEQWGFAEQISLTLPSLVSAD